MNFSTFFRSLNLFLHKASLCAFSNSEAPSLGAILTEISDVEHDVIVAQNNVT